MNILYVVPYVPSLVRVRPYNLIRYLGERGHQVTVLTLWTAEQEQMDLKHLKQITHQVEAIHLSRSRSLWNSIQALPSKQPLQSVYSWHPFLADRLLDICKTGSGQDGFDVVHVEHLRGARYGLVLKKGLINSGGRLLPVIWDSVDSITLLFRQASQRSQSFFGKWLTRFELGRTERYEGWLASQFDRITVTSELDRDALVSLSPNGRASAKVEVVPNGVDLEYFKPDEGCQRDPATLVLSGKMSYHANVSMVLHLIRKIMPLVWAQQPEVKVVVAGKDPGREILALKEDGRVEVTGTVDDIRPYLQRSTMAVVPITYGTGIQNKVLEAMATGTPVVSSSRAVAALNLTPGENVLVADEPVEFAESILCLLNDRQRQKEVGESGRRYVEQWHRWDHAAARLEQIYQEVL